MSTLRQLTITNKLLTYLILTLKKKLKKEVEYLKHIGFNED